MSAEIVVDASVLVPALLGLDRQGEAAARALRSGDLAAPALLPFEVTQVVRRLEQRGTVSSSLARIAVEALSDLRWRSWPFDALADRVWELRANLTAYDAAYVALAERLQAPLLTFDARIGRAPGVRCDVVIPA